MTYVEGQPVVVTNIGGNYHNIHCQATGILRKPVENFYEWAVEFDSHVSEMWIGDTIHVNEDEIDSL